MTDELDEIRARIGIVHLVSQSVNLKRSGRNWLGLCPFHDDRKPSFNVSDTHGRYKCWACGESGDIFTWVMKTQNVSFSEAVEVLARQAGVTLRKRRPEEPGQRLSWQSAMAEALAFFRSELAKSSGAKEYCERRGISQDVITKWEIGYAPDVGEALAIHLARKTYSLAECQKLFLVEADASGGYYDKFRGRLIFPIRDERGDLVAFGGRILGDGHPKYINSSDTPLYRKSRVLYGMNVAKEAIARGVHPVLCEGYLDVIACHSAGVEGAVASLGTALSDDHARMLKRWAKSGEVIVLYDADEAGERAAARAAEILEREGLKARIALMPEGEDPDTLLRKAGGAAVQAAAQGGLSPTEFKIRQIEAKYSVEDDRFWSLAAEALAECRSELESAKFVQYLAAKYPYLRDPMEARKALSKMVKDAKRSMRQPEASAAPARGGERPKLGLKSAEASLFRAALNEEYRGLVWARLKEPDLFLTGKGSEVAAALAASFDAPPKGPPSAWLHQVEPAEFADFLLEVDLAKEERLTEPFVKETIELLVRKREERQLRALRESVGGDERLRLIQERLSNLKS